MSSNGDCLNPVDPHFATKAIHEGQEPEQWKSMAVVPPISLSSTFKQSGPAEHAGYEYSRSGNPTRNCLEKCLAALDNAKYACCFASGLNATDCIVHMLKAGDHIVSMDDLYGGTNRLFRRVASEMNIETTFVDCTILENVEKSIKENTRLVWIESPSNPMLRVVDIKAVADVAHRRNNIMLVVDNTFMSPYFQQPLDLGADVVLYSLTKYMNGHTDVVMGSAAMNREDLHEKLRFLQNSVGAVPSPFDCFLVNRGIKTLHLRMREHMANGLAVAKFLENHPCVQKVNYTGLPAHPQYEISRRQCSGHSGMMSFYIKGGVEEARVFFRNLKIFTLAESLGGYESLTEHPGLMTHASVPEDQRKALGISDNLIRLSVGIEAAEDLIKDLDNALRIAVPVHK